jgi:hypothetical protein
MSIERPGIELVSLKAFVRSLVALLGFEHSKPLLLQRSHLVGQTLSTGLHCGTNERLICFGESRIWGSI